MFELLVRQIASDTVSNKDSAAIGLVTDKDTDASGEQVKHEPKKPNIDQKRLGKALEAIAEGKYTKDELLANFSLTDSQIKLLENV